ncbi:MAG: NAD(P)H-hydrate dehydratase [Eubacterium sp.]|nr:NAD(P)H-hydrate dehydratase [Eubacterium sp.]
MRYLMTGKQAAEIDRFTIEEIGVPQLVLMERASLAVAEEVTALVDDRKKDRILVVAESGNNGGDGVAAARILHQRGYRVEIWALNGINRRSEAYEKQVDLAGKAGVPFVTIGSSPEQTAEKNTGISQEDQQNNSGYRVIVDAIFGVGLTREVKGVQRDAVEWINRQREEYGAEVLAVDIPTGISSDNGEVLGMAVHADRTVTFGFEKMGMRFAKESCGKISVKEIGFFLPAGSAGNGSGMEEDPSIIVDSESIGDRELYYTYEKEDIRTLLPVRSMDGNKGSFGRVLVIAGSKDISGAAYLAAEAAYRTGCGLVKVVTHENNRTALQKLLPEALLQCYDDMDKNAEGLGEAILWASAIIIGPGIGRTETARNMLEKVLREAVCPVVADADAVNLLAEHTELLTPGKRQLILTPHMLEMTRLAEKTFHPERKALERLKKERIRIVREMAERYQATVVLKDACTVVADAGGSGIYLNSSGCDAMAKGGSGDVLTGVIAALIAQGMTVAGAARLGVYLHGLAGEKAAEQLGSYCVLAGDLIRMLPEIFR